MAWTVWFALLVSSATAFSPSLSPALSLSPSLPPLHKAQRIGGRSHAAGVRMAGDGLAWPWSMFEELKSGAAAQSEASIVQKNLMERRTINDFDPVLPDDWKPALMRALETAVYAPNHKRTEPWRFHLLGQKSIKAVCELNAEMVAAKKGEDAGAKKLKRWMQIPGWLVVTQLSSDADEMDMTKPNSLLREDYAACCCAVQNLCLSLHAEGLGTKWTTGDINFDSRFYDATGIPSSEKVVGTIWFGAAAKTPDPPRKKLAVEDVLVEHA